jgi:hypothetical protein
MGKGEETKRVIQGLISDFLKQLKLDCGAERHHYSMFNVGSSMFDVHLFLAFNSGLSGFDSNPFAVPFPAL